MTTSPSLGNLMLSRSAEYALRIMAYLALHSTGIPLRAKDIAEEINIPPAYLSKILRRMVTSKLLNATKGHKGGFVIARPSNEICFAEIFQSIEKKSEQASCVFGWDKCSDKHPCVLHNRWKEAKSAFERWSQTTTLADVQKDMKVLEKVAIGGTLRDKIRKSRK